MASPQDALLLLLQLWVSKLTELPAGSLLQNLLQ